MQSEFYLRLADDHLILGQNLAKLCGHGPMLEEDLAITNISLDLLGVARLLYEAVAEDQGEGCTEDRLAMLRPEKEYVNCLLVEQPDYDFAYTIVRQWLFSQYAVLLWGQLAQSTDSILAGIAAKAVKESAYHLKHAADWLLRLGDGTAESHQRAQAALDVLWCYAGELFVQDELMAQVQRQTNVPNLTKLAADWQQAVRSQMTRATLHAPTDEFYHTGGRSGEHSEHLGHILSELQYMQRTYPGLAW